MADRHPPVVTPVGTFVYPKLNQPDTKFKEEGEYSVKLRLSEEDAKPLVEMADRLAAESLAEAMEKEDSAAKRKKWETKYLPYEVEEDEDGDPTGNVLFKFSMKASGISRKTGKEWKRSPKLFDAKGNIIDRDEVAIWGGTEGRVSFVPAKYAATIQTGASVSFKLEAVKVLNLVSARSAGAYGFGDDDEGYEYEEPEASSSSSSSEGEEPEATPAGDGEEDF